MDQIPLNELNIGMGGEETYDNVVPNERVQRTEHLYPNLYTLDINETQESETQNMTTDYTLKSKVNPFKQMNDMDDIGVSTNQECIPKTRKIRVNSNKKNAINILLLSESDVEKSLFINAFEKYLFHKTWKEANDEDTPLASTDPKSYDMLYDNMTVPQSSAHECKSYELSIAGRIITLIDTPGIGDTRGIEQDRANWEHILNYVTKYEELHCICILLKAKNSPIDDTFEYYIMQVLSNVHKGASTNIVFMFTDSTFTYSMPGENAIRLRRLLSAKGIENILFEEDFIYSIDYNAFKQFIEHKKGKLYIRDEMKYLTNLWKISHKECQRLMKHIISADEEGKPGPRAHRVEDTIALNSVRRFHSGILKSKQIIENDLKHKNEILNIERKVLNEMNQKLNNSQQNSSKTVANMYSTEGTHRYVNDTGVENEMRFKRDDITYKVRHIRDIEEKTQLMVKEMDLINTTLRAFTKFLVTNAIIPYNDSIGKYIANLIHKEVVNKNTDNTEGLTQMFAHYSEESHVFENMTSAANIAYSIGFDRITELVKSLCELEMCGHIVLECIAEDNHNISDSFSESPLKAMPSKKALIKVLTPDLQKPIQTQNENMRKFGPKDENNIPFKSNNNGFQSCITSSSDNVKMSMVHRDISSTFGHLNEQKYAESAYINELDNCHLIDRNANDLETKFKQKFPEIKDQEYNQGLNVDLSRHKTNEIKERNAQKRSQFFATQPNDSDSEYEDCTDQDFSVNNNYKSKHDLCEYKTQNTSQSKNINILVLGETGVGKSTFINAFANYLTYDTLNEAKDVGLVSLIPTSFNVTDLETYKERLIRCGSDDNENYVTGESATQGCKSYVFPFAERQVRLIDTPGVGDTRGVDQDFQNFENILDYISQYEHLHCICILLKPNNSRINVMFEFCIKQLLSHLQKSASNNIVFLFTNARSTFYRPGDTAPALRKMLNTIKTSPPYVDIVFTKETIFCLDNESFRFLVALKNGIDYKYEEMNNFSQSWKKSSNECLRLMQYIMGTRDGKAGLTAHVIQDTLLANGIRRIIVGLSRLLIDILQNIKDNTNIMEQKINELKCARSKSEVLYALKNMTSLVLETTYLGRPRTVCGKVACCSKYTVGGRKRYAYSRICHSDCQLKGVKHESVGDRRLEYCHVMDRKYCTHCGHHYREHLHIDYECRVVERKTQNKEFEKQIQCNEYNEYEVKHAFNGLEESCRQMKGEMSFIIETMAMFTHYMKCNSIVSYNDAFAAYLQHLIQNEESLSLMGASVHQNMTGLIELQTEYEQHLSIYEHNMRQSNTVLTAQAVHRGIAELSRLKMYGHFIQSVINQQSVSGNGEQDHKGKEVVYRPQCIKGFASLLNTCL